MQRDHEREARRRPQRRSRCSGRRCRRRGRSTDAVGGLTDGSTRRRGVDVSRRPRRRAPSRPGASAGPPARWTPAPRRRRRAPAPAMPASPCGAQDLDGREHPAADARPLERVEPLPGVAAWLIVSARRLRRAQVDRCSRADEPGEHDVTAAAAAIQRRRTIAAPSASMRGWRGRRSRRCGQSSRGPSVASTTGSRVERDRDAHERDRACRRSRRCAGTAPAATTSASSPIATVVPPHHGAPGGRHRPRRRAVLVACAVGPLLAPARRRSAASSRSPPRDRRARSGTPTIADTDVTAVSAHTSTKLVRIEIAATTSGTKASSDAKTNTSTMSAPTAPMMLSARRPRPPFWPPDADRASMPLTCTCAPAMVAPRSAARTASTA